MYLCSLLVAISFLFFSFVARTESFSLMVSFRGKGVLHEIDQQGFLDALERLFHEVGQSLWYSLDGRSSLTEVTVMVPQEWDVVPRLKRISGPQMEVFPDIQIDYGTNGYRDLPWVLQTSLCASPGAFVSITPDFVKNPHILKHTCGSRAQILGSQILKYRYGVYDEHGCGVEVVLADPVLLNGQRGWQVRPNVCPHANTDPLKYEQEDVFRRIFSHSWHPFLWLVGPEGGPIKKRKGTSSSLCTNEEHDPTLPHAHNRFCGGQSWWHVMEGHSDFQGGTFSSVLGEYELQNKNRNSERMINVPETKVKFVRAPSSLESTPLQLEARFSVYEAKNGDGFPFLLPLFHVIAVHDGSPILNLKVSIRVLTKKSEGESYYVALDNGLAPDLRANDGVYTLAVVSESEGIFQFVVEVEGKHVKLNKGIFGGTPSCPAFQHRCEALEEEVTDFNVAVSSEPQMGVFPSPTLDALPPPPVPGFTVEGRNHDLACGYTLHWRSVRSAFNTGPFASYKVRCGHTRSELVSSPCFSSTISASVEANNRRRGITTLRHAIPPGFCLGPIVCSIRGVSMPSGATGDAQFAAGFCLPPSTSNRRGARGKLPEPAAMGPPHLPEEQWGGVFLGSGEERTNGKARKDGRPTLFHSHEEGGVRKKRAVEFRSDVSNGVEERDEAPILSSNEEGRSNDKTPPLILPSNGVEGRDDKAPPVLLIPRAIDDHYLIRKRGAHLFTGLNRSYYFHYSMALAYIFVAIFCVACAVAGCSVTIWCAYTLPPPDEPFVKVRRERIICPSSQCDRSIRP